MQLFVDRLTNIDCSYLHPDHGIEGESWLVDIVLAGELDDASMIMDFGLVKKRIKALIDYTVDHCLLVPGKSAALHNWQQQSGQVELRWQDHAGRSWELASPAQALCRIETDAITPQTVAVYLQHMLHDNLPDGIEVADIQLYTPQIEGPYYHYSHGLKKHDGNCQRIAHGHRSRLEIWRNGEPDGETTAAWASRWAHIYLVSQEDIISQEGGQLISGYDAPQGTFRLSAPRECCDVLPYDSTVERIAQHIAETLKTHDSASEWRVKAYEGIGKGALFTA